MNEERAEAIAAPTPKKTASSNGAGKALLWIIGIIIAGFVLLAGLGAITKTDKPEGASDFEYIRVNEERIASRLKDPGSAQFRGSVVSRSGGVPVVCGEVNAKNGFGGYTGHQRFVSGGSVQVLETEMAAGEMDGLWRKFC